MRKGDGLSWALLGRVEKAFLAVLALYALDFFTGILPSFQLPLAIVGFFLGVAALVRLGRFAARNLIWRLRNRLIVAYVFIAVVPVVLILALLAGTAYLVVGQTAVYLVNTELNNRMRVLTFPANAMVRAPARVPQAAFNQALAGLRRFFPTFELLATGENAMRYPPDSKLEAPPEAWKNTAGLVLKKVDGKERLFAWAHAEQNANEVTILAPITHEVLATLVPGIGDVNFNRGYTTRPAQRSVPPAANALDFPLTFLAPVDVPFWEAPNRPLERIYLLVDTRFSAVLGVIFGQKADWSDALLTLLLTVIVIFFLVEIAALYAGVKVTRSITGAVHELYEGTLHVQKADFGYRIPVKGNDQLAELGESFNAMTQNLGRLIIVAKEKERLESELTIAREVQNQLFPKSAPPAKTIQLSGVCN